MKETVFVQFFKLNNSVPLIFPFRNLSGQKSNKWLRDPIIPPVLWRDSNAPVIGPGQVGLWDSAIQVADKKHPEQIPPGMPSCSNSNAANDCDPNLVDCCTYPTQMQSGWATINQCTLMAWSALKRPLAHHRTISGTPPALWSPLQNSKQNKLRYHNLVPKCANSTILPLHYDGHVYNMSCNLQATTTNKSTETSKSEPRDSEHWVSRWWQLPSPQNSMQNAVERAPLERECTIFLH